MSKLTINGLHLRAHRASVVPLVTGVDIIARRGWWVTHFAGTQADLLAAGVAQPYMFEVSKSGSRTRYDEHGDWYSIRRVRRPAGRWELCRRLWHEPACVDITDWHPSVTRRKWVPEARAAAKQIVDEAIAKARRPGETHARKRR